MIQTAEAVLVGSVVAVGVLHTVVPDHWVPITLVARQRHWTTRETARAALLAGTGHVTSTLLIGLVVWVAGALFAARFGRLVSVVSSVALVAFGVWIAAGAWREMHGAGGHHHEHEHEHEHEHGHDHEQKASSSTALLLILGSSPMVEGIPAFFAAGKYGAGLIIAMAIAFGISTISTYVLLCVASTVGLQRVNLGSFEKYGEVASGAFIALIGAFFLFVPVL